MDTWRMVLMSQIWHVPFLAIYILGLVLALTRRDLGQASRFAALGFSLMILGSVISTFSMYNMMSMREGGFEASRYMRSTAAFAFATMIVNLAGWAMTLAAIFVKRPPPSTVE